MARINIVNADNKIDATPQRAYFKLKQTGGPKGEKGDTGAQGPQGATGPQGASASVVVNSTTTLPAGSDATVENIGTPQNVKLNFGIPTGPQGPQGEQGPQGAQGPQGLKGDTGAKGADGAAAKVTVGNTNTGAAGTNASVENTGNDTYAVLNFTIPRGDKGETGPMPEIAQTTGQATDEVMSQKATTDALATKQNNLTAGTGITIASDTVSADTTVLATKADLNGYAPQATTYTKTETDALLAPKLEADVVDSLPETGEEGKLYLTPKNYTRQTATGNPITATISDGAGTIESFQLDGDTFQQTYTGKNLAVPEPRTVTSNGLLASYDESTGEITISGTATSTWSNPFALTGLPLPAGTYTLSQTGSLTYGRLAVSVSGATTRTVDASTKKVTFTINSDAPNSYIWIAGLNNGNVVSGTITAQLESGSEVTDFEKFVGGQPSPSPDYPQAVRTVTGEQTVTINGAGYTVNLGDIELCKLGTYQDYIWKDGEDWKVHKTTEKVTRDVDVAGIRLNNSSGPTMVAEAGTFAIFNTSIAGIAAARASENLGVYKLDESITGNAGANAMTDGTFCQRQGTNDRCYFRNTAYIGKTGNEMRALLLANSGGANVYYYLSTPADTTITNSTLIAQLEAIRTAALEDGTNTIANSAAGANLAGDMEITYYGYNPTNRYDKFIWLDLNNNYEQIGE